MPPLQADAPKPGRRLLKQYEVAGRTLKKPGEEGYNPGIDDVNDDIEFDDANA